MPDFDLSGIEINTPALCGTTPASFNTHGQVTRIVNFMLDSRNNPALRWADLYNNGYTILTAEKFLAFVYFVRSD